MGSYGTVWEPSTTGPHLHNAVAGQGGSLNSTTQINGAVLIGLVLAQ